MSKTDDTKKATKQKGQLIRRKAGWYGRYYATVDGERIRVARALGTTSKAVARAKLDRLVEAEETSPSEAKRGETFGELAPRLVRGQGRNGLGTWKDRLSRLERYALPLLGQMTPDKIKAAHVREVLEGMRALGMARQTMVHVKNDVSSILGELWGSEMLPENVCKRVSVPEALPEATARSKKERAVLTDEELIRYLGWVNPEEHKQMATLERQVMCTVSRCFGGLRTSDLHHLKWEGFKLPTFETGLAPRKKGSTLSKGGRPQRLHVPEMLRPILADWWERAGRPSEGLVFPARRGLEVVGPRKRTTHAEAFRTDLRRAFGLDEPTEEVITRRNGRQLTKIVWKQAREMTSRERELFTETEWTKPVDFHSWRRAFNQALADAGVNAQTAQALAGHASMAAHERYVKARDKVAVVPDAALPQLGVKVLPENDNDGWTPCTDFGHSMMGTLSKSDVLTENQESPNSQKQLQEAVGFSSGKSVTPEAAGSSPVRSAEITQDEIEGEDTVGTPSAHTSPPHQSSADISSPDASLEEALRRAAISGQWDAAADILDELRARRDAGRGKPPPGQS